MDASSSFFPAALSPKSLAARPSGSWRSGIGDRLLGALGWRSAQQECSSGGIGGFCGADRVWSPCDPYACSLGTYDLRAATKKVA